MSSNQTDPGCGDLSFLTPHEQKMYELSQKGLSYKAMSDAMGGEHAIETIQTLIKNVREKVALKEIIDAQDRRISWP